MYYLVKVGNMKIAIGTEKFIEYYLIKKNVKNTTIRIKQDGRIEITCNPMIEINQVEKFILSKKEWIISTREKILDKSKLYMDMEYIDKGFVWLMGIKYNIHILRESPYEGNEQINNSLIKRKISLSIDGIHLQIKIKGIYTDIEINNKIKVWLDDIMNNLVKESLDRIYPLFSKDSIPYPNVKIRTMNSRWGSCKINSDNITINHLLVHVPVVLLDYVIAHELTHFIYGDHSKNFYNKLMEIMPNHKQLQQALKGYMIVK